MINAAWAATQSPCAGHVGSMSPLHFWMSYRMERKEDVLLVFPREGMGKERTERKGKVSVRCEPRMKSSQSKRRKSRMEVVLEVGLMLSAGLKISCCILFATYSLGIPALLCSPGYKCPAKP